MNNGAISRNAFETEGGGTVYIFAPAGSPVQDYCNEHEENVFVEA